MNNLTNLVKEIASDLEDSYHGELTRYEKLAIASSIVASFVNCKIFDIDTALDEHNTSVLIEIASLFETVSSQLEIIAENISDISDNSSDLL